MNDDWPEFLKYIISLSAIDNCRLLSGSRVTECYLLDIVRKNSIVGMILPCKHKEFCYLWKVKSIDLLAIK
jgi:hypothetical protein